MLAGSEPVPAAVVHSLSCWLLGLFSARCFRNNSVVSHVGLHVTEEWLSEVGPETHRKEHFSEIQETPVSLAGVFPAEGGDRRGLAHSQEWIGHLLTQLYTIESKKPQTSLITTFWWVVISFSEHQDLTSQHFCTCKINWNINTWLRCSGVMPCLAR